MEHIVRGVLHGNGRYKGTGCTVCIRGVYHDGLIQGYECC
jgi:hypothetical protein